MKIETKFDVGQTVFFVLDKDITSAPIDEIKVFAKATDQMTLYYLKGMWIHYGNVFATAAEVAQDMMRTIWKYPQEFTGLEKKT